MSAGYSSSKVADERLHNYGNKLGNLWVEIMNEIEKDSAFLLAEQEREAQGLDVDEHGMTLLAGRIAGMTNVAERFASIRAQMDADAHSPLDGADVQNP